MAEGLREGLRPEAESTGPDSWRDWLEQRFPEAVKAGFAEHHEKFWEWVWQISPGVRPRPYVAIWPRGHGKSTNMELAFVALAARGARGYGLYICGTQDQANDHVQNIADLLDNPSLEQDRAGLTHRKVTKYGVSAGWKRNRLRTESGFTIDAVGLDKGFRGLKLEQQRPDVFGFDDVDGEEDSSETTEKKIRAITDKALPAGADDLAVMFGQNEVHEDSVAARLHDGRAKFLSRRIVSGPIPALMNMSYEEGEDGIARLGGTPTWDGMDLPLCQAIVETEGIDAFRRERQHERIVRGGYVYDRSQVDAALERGKNVIFNPGAEQFVSIDPGFSRRAAVLWIQERGEKIDLWNEWSFTRVTDDELARRVAKRCAELSVTEAYIDAEDPDFLFKFGIALDDFGAPTEISPVPFNQYKASGIKVVRWMLGWPMGASSTLSLKADETTVFDPRSPEGRQEPSLFRREIRRYRLKPGEEDKPVKKDDHGPDALTAYAVRWIPDYLDGKEA